MASFSERLRQAMEAEGLGPNDLGRKIGKKPGYISNTIGRESVPGADVALELARALNIRFEWLVAGEPPMRPLTGALAAIPTNELAAELARRLGSPGSAASAEPKPADESGTRQRAITRPARPRDTKGTG